MIESEDSATTNDAEDHRRRQALRNRMDIDDSDIVVAGANTTRISRKQVSHSDVFVPLVVYIFIDLDFENCFLFCWND